VCVCVCVSLYSQHVAAVALAQWTHSAEYYLVLTVTGCWAWQVKPISVAWYVIQRLCNVSAAVWGLAHRLSLVFFIFCLLSCLKIILPVSLVVFIYSLSSLSSTLIRTGQGVQLLFFQFCFQQVACSPSLILTYMVWLGTGGSCDYMAKSKRPPPGQTSNVEM
jgi:hypothetical protein